ncbi:MAG: hypothetical protein R2799_12900 [Crocinitomicaceae bacterium]
MKNLIIISLLFLFSCAKEGKNIYIEGKVVNPITGEGIPNVRLLLKKKVNDLGSLTSVGKIKQEAISDVDGNFVLKHNGSLFHTYIVLHEFIDEGYHLVGWKDEAGQTIGGYQLEVKKGELMNVRLELLPYAEFKVEAYNVNCFDQTDTMLLYKQNQIGSLQEGPWIYPGCNSFLGGYNKVPMGKIYFSWHVIRNGITNIYSDTIYLDEGEQETFTINY